MEPAKADIRMIEPANIFKRRQPRLGPECDQSVVCKAAVIAAVRCSTVDDHEAQTYIQGCGSLIFAYDLRLTRAEHGDFDKARRAGVHSSLQELPDGGIPMSGWLPALLALTAGALGGILNALTTDNGFIVPRFAPMNGGGTIWRPGVIGNLVVGAIAALVSWALYGPAAGLPIGEFKAQLTWAGFASAVLVGIGGARWLSAEVDKSLLKGAAAAAAGKQANQQLAGQIAALAPAAALAAAVHAPN